MLRTYLHLLCALFLCASSLACESDRPPSESTEPADPAAEEELQPAPEFSAWQADRALTFEEITSSPELMNALERARWITLGSSSPGIAGSLEIRASLTLAALRSDLPPTLIALEITPHEAEALNSFVLGDDDDAAGFLKATFTSWPPWPWKSKEFAAFLQDLHAFVTEDPEAFVPFVGLSAQRPYESIDRLLAMTDEHHPEASAELRRHFTCLERYRPDPINYLRAIHDLGHQHHGHGHHHHGDHHDHDHHHDHGDDPLCEDPTASAHALIARTFTGSSHGDLMARGHARGVLDFEINSRAYFHEFPASENRESLGYLETLQELLSLRDEDGGALIWLHNTHAGDTRGSADTDRGLVRLGTLLRETYGPDKTLLVGIAAHQGHLIAAADTRRPPQLLDLPPAIQGSLEDLLQHPEEHDAVYIFEDSDEELPFFADRPGHRRVFNVFDPPREHFTAYVGANPAQLYDALIFLHETEALHLLEEQ